MRIGNIEVSVSIEARFPLPVHQNRDATNYEGTYALHWKHIGRQTLELKGDTVEDVMNAMYSLPKTPGADCMKVETRLTFSHTSEDGTKHETDMTLRHDRDMDLHTYISEDWNTRIPFRYSGYDSSPGKRNQELALLKAAKAQGLTELRLKSVIGSIHHHTLGTIDMGK